MPGLVEGAGQPGLPLVLPHPPLLAASPCHTQEAQFSDEAVACCVGPKVFPTSQGGPPGLCQPSHAIV